VRVAILLLVTVTSIALEDQVEAATVHESLKVIVATPVSFPFVLLAVVSVNANTPVDGIVYAVATIGCTLVLRFAPAILVSVLKI
jgi:hypothetical protein